MLRIISIFLFLVFICQASFAESARDIRRARIQERIAQQGLDDEASSAEGAQLPAGVQIKRDISYGSDKKQTFDVYYPEAVKNAPVIFMVHGGAWAIGDKTNQRVVQNKVARWVPKGFVFISANYRLLPGAEPIEQARDVVRALAKSQEKASSWGGDNTKFILMGHSAGAHLVSLIATDPDFTKGIIKNPWLGTVALDSAAYDVVEIMSKKHYRLYDHAFGTDKQNWIKMSPFYAMTKSAKPLMAVCSTQREGAVPQARQLAKKAASLGVSVNIIEENLSHAEINFRLGEDSAYTKAVESFMSGLNEDIANRLKK